MLEGIDLLRLEGLMNLGYEERDGALVVHAELRDPQTPTCTCPNPKVRKHGKRAVEFKDHPIQRQPVFLRINRQRYRCEGCKMTLMEDLPGIDTNRLMTVRFRNQLAIDAIPRTFRDAGLLNGVEESLARRIFHSYAAKRLENYTFELPRVLGMDEKVIQGSPRFVMGDVETRKMLDLQPSRRLLDLEAYLHTLDGREKVEVITQDMYWAYKTINERFFRRAMVVIDKFHVVRYANLAVESVRKSVQAKLANEGRVSLKRKIRLLAARPENLSEQGKYALKSLLSDYPAIGTAVTCKEWFYDIYQCQNRAEAERAYQAWLDLLPPEMEKHFKPILSFMKNRRWRQLIFNYFEHPYTNAYIESLNGLIDQINRAGRGYDLRYGNVKPLTELYAFALRLDDPETDVILSTMVGHGVDVSTFERDLVAGSFW
ncbi:MAG: ISL3 family transposase [Rhizobiales bacterium]|nr:ISL3 family transposase [Hyphomicrobiales bacterium]